ncbi:MAG: ECF-type sigma factor [Planctomycetota bacterium]
MEGHSPDAERATRLLSKVHDGDQGAADALLPMVYQQLRNIAGGQFRGRGAQHTLQPTALVHEAYLKLIRSAASYNDRGHFCAVAATAMRQILMNHARDKRAAKRDLQPADQTVGEIATPSGASVLDIVALDDALSTLKERNERYARLVELRILAGMTLEEIAALEGVTIRTLSNDWRKIRAWLQRELRDEPDV